MPCAAVHMQLSHRILQGWKESPGRAPVPVADPRVEEAFLHGAMGPDMGFIPGGDRLVSELAHYLDPGDLARALLGGATSELDEAFAWGWASHVLGDVELHPVVGRAVGELLYGDPKRRVDAAENVEAHVSLEVGLDLCIYHGTPELPRPPAAPHFRGPRIHHLVRALEETYGFGWDPRVLQRNHERAVRLTAWWPRALEVLALRGGKAPGGKGSGPVRWALSGLGALSGKGSATRGFLSVRIPPAWVLEEVERRMEGFETRFQGLVDSGLERMENRNLETGEHAGPGRGHPASDAVVERVRRMRSHLGQGGFPGRTRIPA